MAKTLNIGTTNDAVDLKVQNGAVESSGGFKKPNGTSSQFLTADGGTTTISWNSSTKTLTFTIN